MRSIPEEDYFVTDDDQKIKDIDDLISFIKRSGKNEFSKYVSIEKNLFGDWVSRSLENEGLAERLYRAFTRRKMLKVLNAAASEFRRYEKRELKIKKAEQKKKDTRSKDKKDPKNDQKEESGSSTKDVKDDTGDDTTKDQK
jgi:hypothetical protein